MLCLTDCSKRTERTPKDEKMEVLGIYDNLSMIRMIELEGLNTAPPLISGVELEWSDSLVQVNTYPIYYD